MLLSRLFNLFSSKKSKNHKVKTNSIVRFTFKLDSLQGNKIELSNNHYIDKHCPNVRELTEASALKFIENGRFLDPLIFELGLNKPLPIHKEIVEPFIQDKNDKPGDIDLIIYEKGKPDKAIAIEVKVVKVRTEENETILNKEKNISKGITQANAYARLGFHKTYLIIMVLDDASQVEKPNLIFRKSDLNSTDKLYNNRVIENLHERIGLIYFHISQPLEGSILHNTVTSIEPLKKPIPIIQTRLVTSQIKRLNDVEDI